MAVAAALPLEAHALAARRVRSARALLGLGAPPAARGGLAVGTLAAVPVLLAVAAAQPAFRSDTARRVRSDAQLFVVFDVSRSMLASAGPGSPTRLDRARRLALRVRAGAPDVPVGVATFTDRSLPDLFPTGDEATFARTVERVVSVESPPPRDTAVTATDLGSLAAFGTSGFFPPAVRHRVIVVLTDGESRPFSASAVAHALAAGPGVSVALLRLGSEGDRIYGPGGAVDPRYRPDSGARHELDSLAAATGGRVCAEGGAGSAAAAARGALGRGPTVSREVRMRTTPVAPYVALAALLPLALVLGRRTLSGALPLRRGRAGRLGRIMRRSLSVAREGR